MGSEILSIFILAPLIISVIDLIKVVRNRNRLKHSLLLSCACCLIGYFSMASYLDGYNPMQGLVIGSLLYVPSYLVLYCVLTAYSRKVVGIENIT